MEAAASSAEQRNPPQFHQNNRVDHCWQNEYSEQATSGGSNVLAHGRPPAQNKDLLDTRVLVWLLSDEQQLGTQTRQLIAHAWSNDEAAVSAISFWEVAMLQDKLTFEPNMQSDSGSAIRYIPSYSNQLQVAGRGRIAERRHYPSLSPRSPWWERQPLDWCCKVERGKL